MCLRVWFVLVHLRRMISHPFGSGFVFSDDCYCFVRLVRFDSSAVSYLYVLLF